MACHRHARLAGACAARASARATYRRGAEQPSCADSMRARARACTRRSARWGGLGTLGGALPDAPRAAARRGASCSGRGRVRACAHPWGAGWGGSAGFFSLWCLCAHAAEARRGCATALCRCGCVQERQRISKFRFRKDAKLALVGRLLLQHTACAALGHPFGMVDFARTKEGKPVISPTTGSLHAARGAAPPRANTRPTQCCPAPANSPSRASWPKRSLTLARSLSGLADSPALALPAQGRRKVDLCKYNLNLSHHGSWVFLASDHQVCVCVCARVRVCVFVCVFACVHVCVRARARANMRACVRANVRASERACGRPLRVTAAW